MKHKIKNTLIISAIALLIISNLYHTAIDLAIGDTYIILGSTTIFIWLNIVLLVIALPIGLKADKTCL